MQFLQIHGWENFISQRLSLFLTVFFKRSDYAPKDQGVCGRDFAVQSFGMYDTAGGLTIISTKTDLSRAEALSAKKQD